MPRRSNSFQRLVLLISSSLAGNARVAKQNDEWAYTGRRYMSLEAIAKTLAPPSPEATMEVAMIAA